MTLTVGSMFAGYGGIELALASVLDVEPVWFAEFDAAPSRILAHHWPDVPNLGDVTKVRWEDVEPVDVITGGSPCQDLSHAGKRAGMTTGTRSNLWVEMREAIAQIRPRLVCWENVRGAGSAEAASSLEQCPRCVGGAGDGKPVLRALGRVVGDLADLGYDSWWYGLRASDVGLAHGRFRFFLFATPADADLSGLEGRHAGGERPGERPVGSGGVAAGLTLLPTPTSADSKASGGSSPSDVTLTDAVVRTDLGAVENPRHLLPTQRATDGTKGGPNQRGSSGDLMLPSAVHLLPTPQAHDAQGPKTPEQIATMRAKGHGVANLNEVAAHELGKLLPTPRADEPGSTNVGYVLSLNEAVGASENGRNQDWREYEAAIRRHEHATGRTAPPPTETGPKGKPRLSPRFVEWLMALPEGWVTDVPGISRNDMLKALGNGVVPAQCAAALRAFIHDTREAVA